MEGFLYLFVLPITIVVGMFVWSEYQRRQRDEGPQIVREGSEYPNNYGVFGAGYYHAADRRWFQYPWNEFREERGYFWAGEWHAEPDQRPTPATMPAPEEIARVNAEWRKTKPEDLDAFARSVQRSGFGTAVKRHSGS